MLKNIALSDLGKPKLDCRTAISEEKLNELVFSIKEHGIIEPIIVRPIGEGKYEIIIGSRRVLAAHEAGLGKVPCIVRKCDDGVADGIRLDENEVRESLSPIDTARYFEAMMQKYGLNQDQVAERVCRTKGYVSQLLTLLRKDPVIRDMVEGDEISYTVARELNRVPQETERRRLGRFAASSGANVTTVRRWVSRALADTTTQQGEFRPPEIEPDTEPLETQVATHPCRACGRVGPLDAMIIFRTCPDCGELLEQIIEQGEFKHEQPIRNGGEEQPKSGERAEESTDPDNNKSSSVPEGSEGNSTGIPGHKERLSATEGHNEHKQVRGSNNKKE